MRDGSTVYVSRALLDVGVPHVFTTRSSAPDERARMAELLGLAGATRVLEARQVHGARVVEVAPDAADSPSVAPEADALVAERPNDLVLVYTADCVPILLASADGGRVAAVHAGWRGVVAGVLANALQSLRGADGGGDDGELRSDVVAAIGPSVCVDCFEVGDEVVRAFESQGLGCAVHAASGDSVERSGFPRAHVDLRAAVEAQLRACGVTRIDGTDRCTYEHEVEFWSHRRDVTHGGAATTGRQLAAIAPRSVART